MSGLGINDVLARKDRDQVFTTIVTLQNDGLASYSEGVLEFHRGTFGSVLNSHDHSRLSGALRLVRSDQQTSGLQQFDVLQKVGMDVTVDFGTLPSVTINKKTRIQLEARGNLLVGTGPFVDTGAVYVIAFTGATTTPN